VSLKRCLRLLALRQHVQCCCFDFLLDGDLGGDNTCMNDERDPLANLISRAYRTGLIEKIPLANLTNTKPKQTYPTFCRCCFFPTKITTMNALRTTIRPIARRAAMPNVQKRQMGGGAAPEWTGLDKVIRDKFPEDYQGEFGVIWSVVALWTFVV
jgi:hypothetical protein